MFKTNRVDARECPIEPNIQIAVDENEILVNYCVGIFNSDTPDLRNVDEVREAINRYFQMCIDKGVRPGNLGLYASLGLTNGQAKGLLSGATKGTASPASIACLKAACRAISGFREVLGSAGKLNPATLIFWQKNYDGLTDVQQVEITNPNMIEADMTREDIERRIQREIPIDADFQEIDTEDKPLSLSDALSSGALDTKGDFETDFVDD